MIRDRLTLVPRRRLFQLAGGSLLLLLALLLHQDLIWRPVVFLLAYLLLGSDVLLAAGRRIARRGWFDEHFLMALATLGAWLIGSYPEAVAVMLFYQVGETMQGLAVDHSRRSIRALLAVRPDTAIVQTETGPRTVDPADVAVGAILLIRPGDRVALDCLVREGQSAVNTAALTGESLPRAVGPGDELMAGSINDNGLLTTEVLRPAEASAVNRILRLVEEAAARKSPAEQLISRFAAVYTPLMVGLALGLALLPPLIWGAALAEWVYRALILLVISCPCALVLSVPLSYFAGLGAASNQGILIKGGQYLDRLARIRTLVWDKTGTLTRGVFSVSRIVPVQGTPEDVLELAALAEYHATHPLARSIVQSWRDRTQTEPEASRIQSSQNLPGLGVSAVIDGRNVLIGHLGLLRQAGIIPPGDHPVCQDQGATCLYLACDGRLVGTLELIDQIRPEAAGVIATLRRLGITRHVLLSGDRTGAVARAAADSGMDDYAAELLPEAKVAELEKLLASEALAPVAYIGDGINDAPVLARADLGLALSHGSDAAMEQADLILVGQDLDKIPQAVRLARRTWSIVRQNIVLSLGLKAIVLLLAVVGLGSIWQAIFADVGVSLIAVLNALRILRRRPTG